MPARVMVVEDEPLIALEIMEAIAEAGYELCGPATSVREGLALIAESGCTAAILDVSLGRESAAPVAEQLRSNGIPFVVVSGYSTGQHPPAFIGAPYLSKPIDTVALVTALRAMLD